MFVLFLSTFLTVLFRLKRGSIFFIFLNFDAVHSISVSLCIQHPCAFFSPSCTRVRKTVSQTFLTFWPKLFCKPPCDWLINRGCGKFLTLWHIPHPTEPEEFQHPLGVLNPHPTKPAENASWNRYSTPLHNRGWGIKIQQASEGEESLCETAYRPLKARKYVIFVKSVMFCNW